MKMSPKLKTDHVWEDKEILFDLPYTKLKLRESEKIYERVDNIEDTKGNNGTRGRMLITNLRIIWHCIKSPRINLSIGLNCLLSITPRMVNSSTKSSAQSVFIMSIYNGSKYEFIFTNQQQQNNNRHYTTLVGVHRAYITSRLYRDLKLRSAIIHKDQLKMLKGEKISLSEHGVWNLSSDTGNLGRLIATNVRIIWYADINYSFNISLPYIAVQSIKIRDSKFGQALVITSRPTSGAYVLGFRIDPFEKLLNIHKELSILYETFTAKPIFGVDYDWGNDNANSKDGVEDFDKMEEIGEPRGEMGSALYLASQIVNTNEGDEEKHKPVFNNYLGLAIEPLKEGFTLQSLWEVQASN